MYLTHQTPPDPYANIVETSPTDSSLPSPCPEPEAF